MKPDMDANYRAGMIDALETVLRHTTVIESNRKAETPYQSGWITAMREQEIMVRALLDAARTWDSTDETEEGNHEK